MKRRSIILTGLTVGALIFTAGAFGVVQNRDDRPSGSAVLAAPGTGRSFERISGASLEETIASLQRRLEQVPGDYASWSTLGLAYVQQAKVTVNSDFYPLAQGALEKSLTVDDDQNFLAYAGLAALANARHDFAGAKAYAERGLVINGSSALLYGALSDAEIQLGEYDAAIDHVQRMVDLSPDTSSLARASYTWEIRGNIEEATGLMKRALDDAPDASSRAFAQYYLGELAFNKGDANGALALYRSALEASPGDAAALEGKARAEAAIGQHLTAIDDYATVVLQAPEPNYLIEYGELLESLGRDEEAQQQYDVFATTQQLFASNGVEPDSDPTLFYANHGDPAKALSSAEAGIKTRPFIIMYDAYAWALHVNGRDGEALVAIDKALETGMRNALFHYHRGMILMSLGNDDEARIELQLALEINPTFNPLAAPLAQAALEQLGGAA